MKLNFDELSGAVALVGAGPGDPELLTMRAARLLGRADVILHDHLVHADILELARPDAQRVFVGKVPGGPRTPQARIHELMLEHARTGAFVVRLKGGDPFVFGRGGEEAIMLREAGVAVEVVPGISSCVAVPASAGIPVTHRGVTTHFTVVTGFGAAEGQELEETWRKIARTEGTLVVLMGVRRLARIVAALKEGGRSGDTPAALIHAGTTPNQRSVRATLDTIVARAADAQITSPATLVVGEVVSLADAIALVAPEAHALPPPHPVRA